MKFSKLTTRIVVTILPVVVISTLLLIQICYSAFRFRLLEETEQKMFAWIDREEMHIQEVLYHNEFMVQGLVSYAESASLETLRTGGHTAFLQRLLSSNSETIGGGIWFEPNILGAEIPFFSSYFIRADTAQQAVFSTDTSNEYLTTAWYQAGIAAKGKLIWTDVYEDPMYGTPILSAIRAFSNDHGKLLGVCTADISLQSVASVVDDVRIGDTGRAFLYDSDRKQLIGGATEASPELLPLMDGLSAQSEGTQTTTIDHTQYIVYYRQTHDGWYMGLMIELLEVYAPLESLVVVTLVITILTLVIMTLAVLQLTRHLHSVIDQINGFSKRAAAGNMDERLHLDVHDEFATIADNLNVLMENMGQMSRAKGDFLSRMSHEIRTPMNAIVGMAQIARGASDPEKVDDCLVKIENSSNHLLGIVNDILDYSKVESGKLSLDKVLFSLTENLDFVVSMFTTRASEKQINLSLTLEGIKHDGILTDSLRLNQVLINLLSNAIKFTSPKGSIELSAEETEYDEDEGMGTYRFAVRDTGIGVDLQQIERLFSPFEQASAHIASQYGGTGLGLTISRSIVDMMGGEIHVQNNPDKGSTFSFTIRVQAQEKAKDPLLATDAAQSIPLPDLTGKRIMIVDDIEINRDIAMELLSEAGPDIDMAEDGDVALSKFLGSPEGFYDLILMDMQMPRMDGCAATRAIRQSGRKDAQTVRIIAMTANVLREDVQRALDAGMDAHIAKPIDIAETMETLRKALASPRAAADTSGGDQTKGL